ncbi:trans-sialidase, partial [Trypanosoma cruzi]
ACFLLDRLPWTMLRIGCSPGPCCTRMAVCVFYNGGATVRAVSFQFSRLTEELSAINSVLSNWAQKGIFFSSLSTPTAGLVAVLSGAASDDTWNDDYLCLHAMVKECSEGQRWATSDGT